MLAAKIDMTETAKGLWQKHQPGHAHLNVRRHNKPDRQASVMVTIGIQTHRVPCTAMFGDTRNGKSKSAGCPYT